MDARTLCLLFNEAQTYLPDDEINRLADLSMFAEKEADNIAATLNVLARVLTDNESKEKPGSHELGLVLAGLASHAELISGVVTISREARYYADKRRAEKPRNLI